MAVDQIYPRKISDLFAAKPVTIVGRYSKAQRGSIKLKAKRAGQAWERDIKLDLPATEAKHDVLAKLWARTHIDSLMAQDWQGLQSGNMRADLRKQITDIGLEYRVMTQFTSFVAVEEKVVTEGGVPRTVQVPVEMPEGVSHEGVFGDRDELFEAKNKAARQAPASMPMSIAAGSAGVVSGSGVGGGAYRVGGFAGGKPEETRRKSHDSLALLTPAQRISPQLQAVVECWKQGGGKKTASTTDPCSVVKDGKVRITIQLTTRDGLPELTAMGFTLSFDNQALYVIGTLPVEKVEELSQKEWVRYISLKN
jgi:Ca-activated chloride channel family protein